MTFTYVLGLLAGLFWLASAGVSFWAMAARLEIGKPINTDSVSLSISSKNDGSGTFFVNGMEVPTFRMVRDYQRTVAMRNGISFAFNALAALCACIAAILSLPAA